MIDQGRNFRSALFDERGGGSDRQCLGDSTELHLEIQAGDLIDGERQGRHFCLEAAELRLDAIVADRQSGECISALDVGDIDAGRVRADVGGCDGRTGQCCAGVIGHQAFNARVGRLR